MKVDVPILISVLSLIVAAVVGISGVKRNRTSDERRDVSEMTTLIVKLENIADGVNEIKSDMRNVKSDVQELRERLIKVEQSTSSAHKRIDDIIKVEKP